MTTLPDRGQLKALINHLLLQEQLIDDDDDLKLCRAIADKDLKTIAELINKYAE